MEQAVLLSDDLLRNFGFKHQPFDRSTSGFVFEDDGHTTQINIMAHMLQTSEQVIFVRGDTGLGKSTLLQRVASVPAENLAFCGIKIVPNVSSDGLFQAVLSAYQLDADRSIGDISEVFEHQMIQLLQTGTQAALLVDDADLLSRESLSNIMAVRHQIFQTIGNTFGLVLAGTPAMDNDLATVVSADYLHVVNLRPYSEAQSLAYLKSSFRHAGVELDRVMSANDIEMLHHAAQGNVAALQQAAVNYLEATQPQQADGVDHSLDDIAPSFDDYEPPEDLAYAEEPSSLPEVPEVNEPLSEREPVQEPVFDMDDEQEVPEETSAGAQRVEPTVVKEEKKRSINWLLVGVSGTVAALVIVLLALMHLAETPETPETVELTIESPKPVMPEPMEAESVTPTVQREEQLAESEETPTIVDRPEEATDAEPSEKMSEESEGMVVEETAEGSSVVPQTDHVAPAQAEPVVSSPKPEIVEEAKPEPKPVVAQVKTPVPVVQTPTVTEKKPDVKASVEGSDGQLPSLSRSEQWLKAQTPKHYTIQLVGANNQTNVDKLAAPYKFKVRDLYVFKTDLKGKDWFILVSGSFDTKEAAKAGIERLPKAIKAYKPWVRSFASIKIKP